MCLPCYPCSRLYSALHLPLLCLSYPSFTEDRFQRRHSLALPRRLTRPRVYRQGEVEQISLMKPKALTEHETGMLEYLEDIVGSSRYKASGGQAA